MMLADNLVCDTMKAALNPMTRGLAMELKGSGIERSAWTNGAAIPIDGGAHLT